MDNADPINTPQSSGHNLTRRAGLTLLSNLLEQGASLIVGFLVTPLIIRGLGTELYGAWTMIQRTAGYLALSDFRPMGTLKFTLAIRQHVEDTDEKQRQIGSALLVWLITLPILLIFGCFVIWATPSFIRTSSGYQYLVQITMTIMILGVVLGRLLSLPGNVLRGMNLGYKAMGLNTVTILVGGLGSIAAIRLGWSIVGVAVAGIFGMALTESVRFWVARQEIAWFRPSRPAKKDFLVFLALSGWFFLSALGALLLNSSDVIIVGVLLGPSAAAVYATTGMVLGFLMSIVTQMLTAGGPGISEICGRRDFLRLEKVRIELHILAFSLMTLVGVGIIIFNRSFLQLWVGKGYYAGNTVNILLVLIAFQSLLYKLDGVIVDCLLDFKSKAVSSLVGGGIIVVMGGWMTYQWGFWGVALAAWLTYMGLWLYFLSLIRKRTGIGFRKYIRDVFWPMTLFVILLCMVSILPLNLSPTNWLVFIGNVFSVALGVMIFLFLLMKKTHKALVLRRLRTLLDR